MKAITICQPYAWLITLPQIDPRHKRIENRTWPTTYRGPILIHAGKSRSWLDSWGDITPAETARLVFGAIVAKAELVDCLGIGLLRSPISGSRLAWARQHIHAEGRFCFILENIRPVMPMPCAGAQGIWEYVGPIPTERVHESS